MKMTPQQYCLRWKHHHTNVQNMFAQLLEKERFCDVTLYCSPSFATQVPNKDTVEPHHIRGVSLRAHRVVLAACSELLGALLGAHEAQGEPVLVLDGAEPKHLKALLDYMYTGEMNVHHSQLASLLKTAEELRIKGLTDIRWNNKDEPPDCDSGVVTAVATHEKKSETNDKKQAEKQQPSPKHASPKHASPKHASPKHASPKHSPAKLTEEIDIKTEDCVDIKPEKFNVNGGPPPLIKLPTKDKLSPPKREQNSDSESPSPKRQRLASGTEHTDDESVSHSLPDTARERDQEWQHGNLDITAERVVGWGQPGGDWSRDASDDEWADAPADIGSFLHTRLRVDGDNSADEESNDSGGGARSVSSLGASCSAERVRPDAEPYTLISKATVGPKSGPTDPRFTDVVKLTDYLQHGRRPQFWEEHYVKRVMEAVRMKELEMKQAAEILGVSYGTLYGRYRDVYGCINRPYRTARDFWQAKGPSEVLDRLQRGDISVEAASLALGVSVNNLAAYMADFPQTHHDKEFEPIPIEIDPSLKLRARTYSGSAPKPLRKPQPPAEKVQHILNTAYPTKQSSTESLRESATDALRKMVAASPAAPAAADKATKKIMIGSLLDEETIPATVIATSEAKGLATATAPATAASGKWPTIRVASLDTLRAGAAAAEAPASPSALMRTRPDLTIVAAKKPAAEPDT